MTRILAVRHISSARDRYRDRFRYRIFCGLFRYRFRSRHRQRLFWLVDL